MEFIPYIGPILGAVPPVLLALFTSPVTALWVLLAFVVIHQFEGHVVVPQIMGDAVGVHPLVVIFGILIGEELYGIPGIILAIPVVGASLLQQVNSFTDKLFASSLVAGRNAAVAARRRGSGDGQGGVESA